MKKTQKAKVGVKRKKRQPPVRIPLPFNQAMKGLLALSPEDAKAAREAANKAKD